MSRECIICGRPLRTGIKYCYTCRSQQKAKKIRENEKKEIIEISKEEYKRRRKLKLKLNLVALIFLITFVISMITKENLIVIIGFLFFIITGFIIFLMGRKKK